MKRLRLSDIILFSERAYYEDRSIVMYILLSIITCGIYPLYNLHAIARDTNELCREDGKHTHGLLMLWLLSFITCGIYPYVWYYKIGERLSNAGYNRQLHINISGSTLLLWMIIGAFLCGIGPFVAMHTIYQALNKLSDHYNLQKHAALNNTAG